MAETELVKAEEPGKLVTIDYGEDAGAGFEGQDANEIQISFIQIVQGLSDQIKPNKPKYIEGAKLGDMYDSVTNELLPSRLLFVPAFKQKAWTQWIDPEHGRGFIERHEKDAPFVIEAKRACGKNWGTIPVPGEPTHQLVETIYMYGIVVDDDRLFEPYMIGWASSKMRPYRAWNKKLNKCMTLNVRTKKKEKVPLFAHPVYITTTEEVNNAGQDYFNFTVTPEKGTVKDSLMTPEDERYQAARRLAEMVKSGEAVAAEEGPAPSDSANDGGGVY